MIIVKFDYNYWMNVPLNVKELFGQFFRWNSTSKAWVSSNPVPDSVLAPLRPTSITNTQETFDYTPNPKLYPHQNNGVKYILNSYVNGYGGFGLYWDVGVGKTLAAVEFINQVTKLYTTTPNTTIETNTIPNITTQTTPETDTVKKFIVLMPSAIMRQFQDEIKNFGYEFESIIVKGTAKKREKLYNELKTTTTLVLIMTYETFRNDYLTLLQNGYDKNTILICDEASKLKSHKSLIHKTVLDYLNKHCEFVLLMTGTPIENKLDDVYNLTQIMYKNKFINRRYYEKNYCVFIEKKIHYSRPPIRLLSHHVNTEHFLSLLTKLSVRLRKSDVRADLPEVSYINKYIESSAGQRKALKELKQLIEMPSQTNITPNTTPRQTHINWKFRAFTLLRMLDNGCEDLKVSTSDNVVLLDLDDGDSEKLKQLVNDLEELEGQQVIIFCSFVESVRLISTKLTSLNISHTSIIGGDDGKDDKIADFKINKYRILVCSDTLSYGVSLPDVDYLINYDQALSLGKTEQRNGRILRINSRNNKTVINYIGDIVGVKIKEILDNKSELNNDVIENIVNDLLR